MTPDEFAREMRKAENFAARRHGLIDRLRGELQQAQFDGRAAQAGEIQNFIDVALRKFKGWKN
jgi:hypothetical protein